MNPISKASIPYVDTAQMIEIDRAMMDDYQIGLIQMMENAGRNLAHLARQRFFSDDPVGKQVAVMAGSGGNGGGALVAARHLHNWGANTRIFLGQPVESMTSIPGHQLEILQRMKIPGTTAITYEADLDTSFDLILDGLIGYSLNGSPRDTVAKLICWANRQTTPILSLDAPSGIDTTTGTIHDPAIKATATMTLALPKTGLRASGVRKIIGELYVADISVPPELYASDTLGLKVGPLFAHDDIIRLW
jgi:NAD(P)H-hydrate epimerase